MAKVEQISLMKRIGNGNGKENERYVRREGYIRGSGKYVEWRFTQLVYER